jgi:RNA polymerase sigma-70 factor (ECF subfamily)
MDRAAAGEDGAFARLAEAVQDDLFRFAVAHGLAAADSAEAVQETLLRAYRARRRWRTGSDAVAWLYGIALNVVREFHRRLRRRRSRGPANVDPAVLAAIATDGSRADPPAADLAALATALAGLPARQREAVSCRYLRRLSVRDTAAAMGCAEGTVKATVSAAMNNLRKRLVEQR